MSCFEIHPMIESYGYGYLFILTLVNPSLTRVFDTRVSSRVLFQVSRLMEYLEELDLHQAYYIIYVFWYIMVVLDMFTNIQLCCTLCCILFVSAVIICCIIFYSFRCVFRCVVLITPIYRVCDTLVLRYMNIKDVLSIDY